MGEFVGNAIGAALGILLASGILVFVFQHPLSFAARAFREAGERFAKKRGVQIVDETQRGSSRHESGSHLDSTLGSAGADPFRRPAQTENVVRIYASFLAASSCGPLDVHDESELPYPKWRIAVELLAAIRRAPTPEERSRFSVLLEALSRFQPRIGEALKSPLLSVVRQAQAIDPSKVDILAAEIASERRSEAGRRYEVASQFVQLEASWLLGLAASAASESSQ
jgi:hypothetical protein